MFGVLPGSQQDPSSSRASSFPLLHRGPSLSFTLPPERIPDVTIIALAYTFSSAMSANDDPAGGHVATATGRTRKRAAEACTFCRRRKVSYSKQTWSMVKILIMKPADQMQCREADMCKLQDARYHVPL